MKTLLVIEDEKNMRMLYQQELIDEGYRVIVAEDGTEAMDKVRKKG